MIKKKFKKGYLVEVINTLGKKPILYIAQPATLKGPAWVARTYRKPQRKIASGRSAEALALKLAKAGHKKVMIWD